MAKLAPSRGLRNLAAKLGKRKPSDLSYATAVQSRRGTIYFIEAVGCDRFKIGFTKGEVEDRRRVLQVCAPFPLRVVAAVPGFRSDETDLHHRFAPLRCCGEWFRDGPDLRLFLAAVAGGQ